MADRMKNWYRKAKQSVSGPRLPKPAENAIQEEEAMLLKKHAVAKVTEPARYKNCCALAHKCAIANLNVRAYAEDPTADPDKMKAMQKKADNALTKLIQQSTLGREVSMVLDEQQSRHEVLKGPKGKAENIAGDIRLPKHRHKKDDAAHTGVPAAKSSAAKQTADKKGVDITCKGTPGGGAQPPARSLIDDGSDATLSPWDADGMTDEDVAVEAEMISVSSQTDDEIRAFVAELIATCPPNKPFVNSTTQRYETQPTKVPLATITTRRQDELFDNAIQAYNALRTMDESRPLTTDFDGRQPTSNRDSRHHVTFGNKLQIRQYTPDAFPRTKFASFNESARFKRTPPPLQKGT